MRPTYVNTTALTVVGVQPAYSEVGHDPKESWDLPRMMVKSPCQSSQHLSHVLGWVIHTSISTWLHPQCIMPSSFHSPSVCSQFKLTDPNIYPGFRFMHMCVSQSTWLSPSLFPFPIVLSCPVFVSDAQPFLPVSIRSMDLEHISLIIHSPPFTYPAWEIEDSRATPALCLSRRTTMLITNQTKPNLSRIVIMTLFCAVRKRMTVFTACGCLH